MKLYHGSNTKVSVPDLSKSKPFKDFGQGFYLSDNYEQAWEMAAKKIKQTHRGEPFVSEFQFDESQNYLPYDHKTDTKPNTNHERRHCHGTHRLPHGRLPLFLARGIGRVLHIGNHRTIARQRNRLVLSKSRLCVFIFGQRNEDSRGELTSHRIHIHLHLNSFIIRVLLEKMDLLRYQLFYLLCIKVAAELYHHLFDIQILDP